MQDVRIKTDSFKVKVCTIKDELKDGNVDQHGLERLWEGHRFPRWTLRRVIVFLVKRRIRDVLSRAIWQGGEEFGRLFLKIPFLREKENERDRENDEGEVEVEERGEDDGRHHGHGEKRPKAAKRRTEVDSDATAVDSEGSHQRRRSSSSASRDAFDRTLGRKAAQMEEAMKRKMGKWTQVRFVVRKEKANMDWAGYSKGWVNRVKEFTDLKGQGATEEEKREEREWRSPA